MGDFPLLGAQQKSKGPSTQQKKVTQQKDPNVESFAGRFLEGGREIFQPSPSLTDLLSLSSTSQGRPEEPRVPQDLKKNMSIQLLY